jgi:hypothetical protein
MTTMATSVPQEYSVQRNALLGTPSQNYGLVASKDRAKGTGSALAEFITDEKAFAPHWTIR